MPKILAILLAACAALSAGSALAHGPGIAAK